MSSGPLKRIIPTGSAARIPAEEAAGNTHALRIEQLKASSSWIEAWTPRDLDPDCFATAAGEAEDIDVADHIDCAVDEVAVLDEHVGRLGAAVPAFGSGLARTRNHQSQDAGQQHP
jgi:hypothetical protein